MLFFSRYAKVLLEHQLIYDQQWDGTTNLTFVKIIRKQASVDLVVCICRHKVYLWSRYLCLNYKYFLVLQTAVSFFTIDQTTSLDGSWKEKWLLEHMEKKMRTPTCMKYTMMKITYHLSASYAETLLKIPLLPSVTIISVRNVHWKIIVNQLAATYATNKLMVCSTLQRN